MECSFCRANENVLPNLIYKRNSYNSCYGDLLDKEENKIYTCSKCISKISHWTEVQFCDAIGIEPMTVAGKIIKKQIFNGGCCDGR
jgi:hypothetical protein